MILTGIIRDRYNGVILFGALVLIYLIISTHFASIAAPTGDEPHYLLISHSIIHDHDFNLANNYRNRDYLLYWPYQEIDAQISPASTEGSILPTHNPGISILLIPFYYIGEKINAVRNMCMLFTIILMALTACNTFSICRTYIDNKKLCFWVTLGAFTSLPLAGYSMQLYPDVPFVFFLTYVIRVILRENINRWDALAIGICLGIMPWLHWKFILIAFILVVFLFFRRNIYRDGLSRYIIAFVSAVMVAGSLIFFHEVYGSLNVVTGQYGFFFSLGFIANGFLGRFIDQQFGIFIYSPWSIFFISGLILMLKDHPFSSNRGLMLWLFIVLMLIVIIPSSTKIELSGKPEWVGDYSMPHRYSVATMPFFIVFVCYVLYRYSRLSYVAAPLFVFSTAFSTVLLTCFPQVLWDSFQEGSVILSVISPAGCDLRALLPNLLMTVMPPYDVALVFSISAGIVFLNLAIVSDKDRKIYGGLFTICLTIYLTAATLGFVKLREAQKDVFLPPALFVTDCGIKTPEGLITDFTKPSGFLALGPRRQRLLRGNYRADFQFAADRKQDLQSKGEIWLDVVVDNGKIIYQRHPLDRKVLQSGTDDGIARVSLKFSHFYPLKYVMFNVYVSGKPVNGSLTFKGVNIVRE